MSYEIYFDESNKLDQKKDGYSYYGALGANEDIVENIKSEVQRINKLCKSKSELHFVDYTSDTNFEKYFNILNSVLELDIQINIMVVNNIDAHKVCSDLNITIQDLRKLFYVKIPERLFYGMTRNIETHQCVSIIIDKNSEYEQINLEAKLEEQMNAHSVYRNKRYKVKSVKQISSEKETSLQIIDTLMGIIVFLIEKNYKKKSNSSIIKSDLIYRLVIHNDNLEKLHNKVNLFKWEDKNNGISTIKFSDYTGEFLVYKTKFDIKQMKRLLKIRLDNPNKDTKYYRTAMGYKNTQRNMIIGYLNELDNKGRNNFHLR